MLWITQSELATRIKKRHSHGVLDIYCKTYFCCILISRFWNVEILLHVNLVFFLRSTSIYLAFEGQTRFQRALSFVTSSHSQKFDTNEKYVLQ